MGIFFYGRPHFGSLSRCILKMCSGQEKKIIKVERERVGGLLDDSDIFVIISFPGIAEIPFDFSITFLLGNEK